MWLRPLRLRAKANFMISIITPAYCEAENLPVLYRRLHDVLQKQSLTWEWIVVDDHSSDHTFEIVSKIAQSHENIRAIRLSKNCGSHVAIMAGLRLCSGRCAVVMAADMQDPPELIASMIMAWEIGAQVVWAARRQREGETQATLGFSRFYYWLMRNIVKIKNIPPRGADFFLIDRQVIQALSQFDENNISLLALLSWMGFRQQTIEYDKQARLHGQSGWSFSKKIKLVVDSITAFSFLPIRAMSVIGFFVALLGFLYAFVVLANRFLSEPTQGWSSLMVVVLVVGGLQMLMMGILGEYLWRALDESRRRPRYLIEQAVRMDPAANKTKT